MSTAQAPPGTCSPPPGGPAGWGDTPGLETLARGFLACAQTPATRPPAGCRRAATARATCMGRTRGVRSRIVGRARGVSCRCTTSHQSGESDAPLQTRVTAGVQRGARPRGARPFVRAGNPERQAFRAVGGAVAGGRRRAPSAKTTRAAPTSGRWRAAGTSRVAMARICPCGITGAQQGAPWHPAS